MTEEVTALKPLELSSLSLGAQMVLASAFSMLGMTGSIGFGLDKGAPNERMQRALTELVDRGVIRATRPDTYKSRGVVFTLRKTLIEVGSAAFRRVMKEAGGMSKDYCFNVPLTGDDQVKAHLWATAVINKTQELAA